MMASSDPVDDALIAIVTEAFAKARTARPDLVVEANRFVRHLIRHVLSARERGSDGTDLVWEDLYLACACAAGDRAAIAELDRIAAREIARVGARLKLDGDTLDEVAQTLRHKLLLAPAIGGDPKIADYAGRGRLARWLGAAAKRIAQSLDRGRARMRPIEDMEEAPAITEGPELAYLRQRYAGEYKLAFEDALGSLPVRSRLLLRMHLLEGLTVDEIARVSGEHRSSTWRALKAARESVVDRARRLLEQRLKLTSSEFESLIFVLGSELDFSLSLLLETDDDPV
jgi:RNA polymerase sigma-70 factor (ECF subfamily)